MSIDGGTPSSPDSGSVLPAGPAVGCPWPIDTACLGQEWGGIDVEIQDRAIALASATLYRLTGYRVGGCPVTVRPCKRGCTNTAQPYWDLHSAGWSPSISSGGVWINSCGCTTDCSCVELCEIVLPAPVGGIVSVKVDGTVVADTNYRVDGNRLVWTGTGTCPWPVCQDLTKPDSAVGTFSVTYLNSYPVDQIGATAAATLALEYARACAGSNKCRLPAGVTQITRQGVSITIAAGAFPGGVTGIREIDSYLALWNPRGLRNQTRVWSPDVRAPRVMR